MKHTKRPVKGLAIPAPKPRNPYAVLAARRAAGCHRNGVARGAALRKAFVNEFDH